MFSGAVFWSGHGWIVVVSENERRVGVNASRSYAHDPSGDLITTSHWGSWSFSPLYTRRLYSKQIQGRRRSRLKCAGPRSSCATKLPGRGRLIRASRQSGQSHHRSRADREGREWTTARMCAGYAMPLKIGILDGRDDKWPHPPFILSWPR